MQSTAVHLNVKGKKVVFGDDEAAAPVGQDASPPRPRGMMIHPSRMQMQTNPQPTAQVAYSAPQAQGDRPAYVPREGGNYAPPRPLKGKLPPSERAPKTAAQARYAKKKQNKLKKKKQAAVRSAPKHKTAPAQPSSTAKPAADGQMDVDGDSSSSEDDSDSDSDSDSDAEEPVKEVAVVEKKRKRPANDDQPTDTPVAQKPTPTPVSDEEEDEDDAEGDEMVADEPPASARGSPPARDLILPASFTSNPLPPFPVLPPSHPAPSASLLHPLTIPHALTTATTISSSHTTPLLATPKPALSTEDEPVASGSSSSSSPPPELSAVSSPTVGLSERMLTRLGDLGVSDLFAVQTGVIPFLLPPAASGSIAAGLHPMKPTRDICVSAPTGSGKTLAYVVPVVEVLSKRIVTRLRALIILPTRDLVAQVKETFESVAKGTGLKIATVTGSQSFAAEQANLVQAGKGAGSSMVDILICTPGRLIDHLNGTPGFSLQFLRFLIIDEADRLLTQSFQDWLQVVLAKTRVPSHISSSSVDILSSASASKPVPFEGEQDQVSQCQKLLFSATLTRDPSKIAALKLHDPQYFVIQDESDTNPTEHVEGEAFAVPATLKEHFLVVPTSLKPLHLLHMLHSPKFSLKTNVLCFTKSVESAARLVELVRFFEDAYVALAGEKKIVVKAYSSDLGGGSSGGERAKVLKQFKKGEVDVLICSDLIARGIDIASVSHVVSYDVPVDMRKYIHRVGRTARAGRDGSAWSLVETQEARHFKSLLRSASHLDKVKKLKVEEEELEPLQPAYKVALERLKDAFAHQ